MFLSNKKLIVVLVAVVLAFFAWGTFQGYQEKGLKEKFCDFIPKEKIDAYEDALASILYDDCVGSYGLIEEDYLDRWYGLNLLMGTPGNTPDIIVERGLCPDEELMSTLPNIPLKDLFVIPVILATCNRSSELGALAESVASQDIHSYREAFSAWTVAIWNAKSLGQVNFEPKANFTVVGELFSKSCGFEAPAKSPCEVLFQALVDSGCRRRFGTEKKVSDRELDKAIRDALKSPSMEERGCGYSIMKLRNEGWI